MSWPPPAGPPTSSEASHRHLESRHGIPDRGLVGALEDHSIEMTRDRVEREPGRRVVLRHRRLTKSIGSSASRAANSSRDLAGRRPRGPAGCRRRFGRQHRRRVVARRPVLDADTRVLLRKPSSTRWKFFCSGPDQMPTIVRLPLTELVPGSLVADGGADALSSDPEPRALTTRAMPMLPRHTNVPIAYSLRILLLLSKASVHHARKMPSGQRRYARSTLMPQH